MFQLLLMDATKQFFFLFSFLFITIIIMMTMMPAQSVAFFCLSSVIFSIYCTMKRHLASVLKMLLNMLAHLAT